MPQEFQVLQCYKCNIFQVDIVKKQPRWQCKMCQEKQSVKQIFLRGSSKDCRLLVQDYNAKRMSFNETCDSNIESTVKQIKYDLVYADFQGTSTGKWSEFVPKANTRSKMNNGTTTLSDFSFDWATKQQKEELECLSHTVDPQTCEYETKHSPVTRVEQEIVRVLHNSPNALLHPLRTPDELHLLENTGNLNMAEDDPHDLKNLNDISINESCAFNQVHHQFSFTNIPITEEKQVSSSDNNHNGVDLCGDQSSMNIKSVSKSIFEENENVDFLDNFSF